MPDSDFIRSLMAVGLLMLLILLRLHAEEFGAAEYDETFDGEPSRLRNRLAWYAIGFGLIGVVYFVHPHPRDTLALVSGRRVEALVYGVAFAVFGVAQAVVFALIRYGDLRLPAVKAYPGAALNTIATAFIDEAAFRGIFLGLLVSLGVESTLAVVVQAIVYALATRLGAPGRHPYMLLLALAIGLLGGWVTIRTGGIGAAFFGHAVTRYAMFVCTGHAGQVFRRGLEPEEEDFKRRPPSGWRDARGGQQGRVRGAEPQGMYFDAEEAEGAGEAEAIDEAPLAPRPLVDVTPRPPADYVPGPSSDLRPAPASSERTPAVPSEPPAAPPLDRVPEPPDEGRPSVRRRSQTRPDGGADLRR